MAYYSDSATEKELAALENRIYDVYDAANADLIKTTADYFASFKKRDEEMLKLLDDGKISNDDYLQWRLNQIGRGERWENLRDKMAQRMTDANKVAAAYINDTTPGIAALNANYEAYVIESVYNSNGAQMASKTVDFTIYNEQTIKNLVKDENKKILPESRVKVPKDLAWNRKQLTNALTSGILQGNSIQDLARSFQRVTSMDYKSAIRNARTSVTGAQNAGRQITYTAAQDIGIEVRKEWMATIDDRTRDSHAELDGMIIAMDDVFPNGLEYPGDPNGAPEEVYNCRCTLRAITKYQNQRESRIDGHEGFHSKESYEKWLDEKIATQKPYTAADATFRAFEARDE